MYKKFLDYNFKYNKCQKAFQEEFNKINPNKKILKQWINWDKYLWNKLWQN